MVKEKFGASDRGKEMAPSIMAPHCLLELKTVSREPAQPQIQSPYSTDGETQAQRGVGASLSSGVLPSAFCSVPGFSEASEEQSQERL